MVRSITLVGALVGASLALALPAGAASQATGVTAARVSSSVSERLRRMYRPTGTTVAPSRSTRCPPVILA